ncbi:hypothetical protein [Pseudoxanthomonas sp. USHLN014]|uniref:hypothetical protein n=1 Tax=Pseudoxanthomonas sp. USHLN014 TaxID=3081297 RepID=UPI00301CD331
MNATDNDRPLRAWILLETYEGLLLEVSKNSARQFLDKPWTAKLHLRPTEAMHGLLKGYEVGRAWSDEAPCLLDYQPEESDVCLFLGSSMFSVTRPEAARFAAWLSQLQDAAEQTS